MSQSLAEQVKEASQEAMASAAAQTEPTGTDEGAGGGQVEQSTAEKPQYLSSITNEEWLALDESAREALSKMGKSLYSDYQAKNKEFADLRKIKAEMDEDPKFADAIRTAVDNYSKGNYSPSEAKRAPTEAQQVKVQGEAEDLIDELKSSEDPAIRAQAAKLEAAIERRLSKSSTISREDFEQLKAMVNQLNGFQLTSREEQVGEALDKLSSAWTPALDKYRPKLLAKAKAHPNLSLDHLLMSTLTVDEYKAATIADALTKEKKQVTSAKQNPGSGSQPAGAKNNALSDKDTVQGRFGKRANTKSLISKMLPDIKKGITG